MKGKHFFCFQSTHTKNIYLLEPTHDPLVHFGSFFAPHPLLYVVLANQSLATTHLPIKILPSPHTHSLTDIIFSIYLHISEDSPTLLCWIAFI
jgi:hypothetical protein